MKRKGQRWTARIFALLLCMAVMLSLCGCPGGKAKDHKITQPNPPEEDTTPRNETPPDNHNEAPEPTPTEPAKPTPTPNETIVDSPAGITTYNVILVMDASESMGKSDSRHSATNAACMFLDSLYASASEEGDERLFGVKNVNASVLSYNDKVAKPASETLLSLDASANVKELKEYLWRINFEKGSHDTALGDALEKAVNMLLDFSRTHGGMTREDTRYLVILATDGAQRQQDSGASLIPIQPLGMEVSGVPLSATHLAVSAEGNAGNGGIPDFGGSGQPKLENALNSAREYGSEIFVLGLNTTGQDAQWEKFKQLSDYTKRAQGETSLSKAGLWGGGIFSDNAGTEKFNYHIADSLVKAQWFYIKMAAAMLQSAPDPISPPVRYEIIQSPERGVDEKFRRFDCDLQSGLSAVIFYALAPGNLSDVKLKGPDPEKPGQMKDYTLSIKRQDKYGWDSEAHRIRNDWYEDASASTLTVLNPEPGKWQFYARCKDDDNASMDGYLVLVNGVDTEVRFVQGTDDDSGEHPFNTGEIRVYFKDMNGVSMPKSFYDGLTEKTCVMKASRFQSKPIPLSLETDSDGNAVLIGTCEVPAPGNYRPELVLKSNQMDYSTSASSVFFRPQTNRRIVVQKTPYTFAPPFLADPWGEAEKSGELKLRIVPDSGKITPKTLATVEASPSRENALLITGLEAGNGELEVSVVMETGDGVSETWTLKYPLEVK